LGEGLAIAVTSLHNAIRANRQPAVNGAEGRKAVELILALYQSAQNGGAPVELPLGQDPMLRKLGVKNA
jgi:predicted dehydrogenase